MPSKLTIYSDGGARGNPGPAAIGILICDAKGGELQEHYETIGDTTNNVAEYMAVIVALELAKKYKAQEIEYFVDSQLVERQIKGEYKVKTPHLQDLHQQVKQREKFFKLVRFHHVPREHAKLRIVDKLVNRALDEAGH